MPKKRHELDPDIASRRPSYMAPLVLKMVQVMNRIVGFPGTPGISRIAADLGLAKSTTHGILAALEQVGWVLRDPVTRKYTCGYVFKELAQSAEISLPLVGHSRPHLKKLSKELDEDVFLGMFTRHYLLILDQVESTKKLKVSTRAGTRVPIFAGAAGKVFLAHFDQETVTKLLQENQLPRFTPRSITDQAKYLAELDKVQREGVAFDSEEYIPDVKAIAAPIFFGIGSRRRIVAGLWVVGLSSDLNEAKVRKSAALAKEAAEAITRELSTLTGLREM
ncbi:MAG: IclR family transcriptional regulator [Thermodesulfobacteriota bacterium]